VLVVDAERTIRFADVQTDYTRRTEVSETLAAVDALDQASSRRRESISSVSSPLLRR
jgi:hypothetical protein